MNGEPKVSVVMPAYNGEEFLRGSIESILNQTYADFEFIIVNDGNEDNSISIINYYKQRDNRIRYIEGNNKGLTNALNKGIAESKGEFIARMDSDDISLPDRIEKQVNYLSVNEDIDILGTCFEPFGDICGEEKTKLQKVGDLIFDDSNIKEVFMECCPLPHPSVMVRKSVLHNLNYYNEEYKCAEDYDLWLRAINAGYRFSKLNERLIKYRIHNKSKTAEEISEFKIMKYVIKARINYIKAISTKNKNINYLIWGASNGGMISKEIINNETDNFKLIGFIDNFKVGEFEGVNIYKPSELKNMKFDYVFICTAPGKDEAVKYLESMNYKKCNDFYIFTS